MSLIKEMLLSVLIVTSNQTTGPAIPRSESHRKANGGQQKQQPWTREGNSQQDHLFLITAIIGFQFNSNSSFDLQKPVLFPSNVLYKTTQVPKQLVSEAVIPFPLWIQSTSPALSVVSSRDGCY